MEPITKRKNVVYFGIGLLFSISILVVLINSMNNMLEDVHDKVRLEEKKYSKAMAIYKQKELIEERYSGYAAFLDPDNHDEELVEKLAKRSGISITNIKPQSAPVVVDDHTNYLITLSANTNIEQLLNFLYSIYQSEYLLTTKEMSIKVKQQGRDFKNGGKELALNMSLALSMFEDVKSEKKESH
ncbi:MAG: hypothetical protein V1872_13450 [bacterium]